MEALFTKRYKQPNEFMLVQALCVIVFLLKDDGILEAENILEVFKIIERKSLKEIHQFEFFVTFRNLYAQDGGSLQDIVDQNQGQVPEGEEPMIDEENVNLIFRSAEDVEKMLIDQRVKYLQEKGMKVIAKEQYERYEVVPYDEIKRGGLLMPNLDMNEIKSSPVMQLQQAQNVQLQNLRQEDLARQNIDVEIEAGITKSS